MPRRPPSGELFVVQARPEDGGITPVRPAVAQLASRTHEPELSGKDGAIGPGEQWPGRVIAASHGESTVRGNGDLASPSRTDPDWEPILKKGCR